jgi:hypothetical protein
MTMYEPDKGNFNRIVHTRFSYMVDNKYIGYKLG